jgi:predicted enzyme related to lactoylglutathione lyase
MNINLVVLKTNQPETLVRFYEQIGFQFNNHRHGNGPLHFAAELPNFVFEIYPLPDGANVPDKTTRLGFTIPHLEGTLAKLKTHGNKVKKEPTVTEWGYQALVEDPDGRKIELTEENTDGKSAQG